MISSCKWLFLLLFMLAFRVGVAQESSTSTQGANSTAYQEMPNTEGISSSGVPATGGNSDFTVPATGGNSDIAAPATGGTSGWLALKTNMLYDAALIPNLGVEIALGRHWSVSADWFYAWWSQDNRHRYWQGYGGYLTVRHYFSPRSMSNGQFSMSNGKCSMFNGHHLGLYVLGLTYDVEWGGRGYQAERFGFGGGVEYGYSWPVSRRLCLDFSLGVGFQDGEYKEYEPADGHYVWQSTHKRHWFGPTKAEVSLKWILGRKGGGR